MNRSPWVVLSALALIGPAAAAPPKPLVVDLKNPESVVRRRRRPGLRHRHRRVRQGRRRRASCVIDGRQGRPVRHRARRPQGDGRLPGQSLFVADKKRVVRIDRQGQGRPSSRRRDGVPDAAAVPQRHRRRRERARCTSAIPATSRATAGRSTASTRRARSTLVADAKKIPAIKTPNGLRASTGESHLLLRRFRLRRAAPHQASPTARSRRSPTASAAATAWPGTSSAGSIVSELEGRQGVRHPAAGRQAGPAGRGLPVGRRPVPRPPPASACSSPT